MTIFSVESKNEKHDNMQKMHGMCKNTVEYENILVMFGGENSINQISDTWILNLSWRDTILFKNDSGIAGDILLFAPLILMSCILTSALINALYHSRTLSTDSPDLQRKGTKHSSYYIEDNVEVDTDVIGESLIQIRKQRALTDIRILEERKKVNLYREENEALKEKVASVIESRELLIEQHKSELDVLRQALIDSVNKCRHLEKLNEEAYTLLMIQSTKNYNEK